MTISHPVSDGSAAHSAARDSLAAIDAWLEAGPPLHPMKDERFLVSLEAFEGSSSQRRQIAAKLSNWTLRPALNDGLRWLSIGCGGGDLDVVVASALAAHHPRPRYVGVDPNPVECARCRKLFAPLRDRVDATVVAEPFERFEDEAASFDLIYAAHTFYYVDDVKDAVTSCMRLLRPGGELVILQAPLAALNQLANRFWEARLGRGVPYSDAIEARLRAVRPLRRFRIDAEVDVTACMNPDDERGQAVLDFILQLDTARLPHGIRVEVRDYLRAISRRHRDRWLAPHPVDGFVVAA